MARYPLVNLEASKIICEELSPVEVEQKQVNYVIMSQRNTMNVE